MNKKIGLLLGSFIFICVLIGTSITVFAEEPDLQTQITVLNQKIDALEKRVSNLETYSGIVRRGNYTLIASFTGSSSVNTDYFYIGKADIRMNWTYSAKSSYPSFSVYLYKEGGNLWEELFSSLAPKGTTYAHNLQTGQYYLEISASGISQWDVTIEVWVPQ